MKPWDLKHRVEFRCAERTRLEDKRREREQAAAAKAESDRLRAKAEAASEEERERASLVRRAVRLWKAGGMVGEVPTDPGQLKTWLEKHENPEAA